MEQPGAATPPVGRAEELSPAISGIGPLLQRDYWAVIEACRLSPRALVQQVSRHFEAFAPRSVAAFSRRSRRRGEPLQSGDVLDVRIMGAGTFAVRVIHTGPQSFTLATVRGHPEAGRITFGAYHNRRGDVVFHIRSRARAGSRKHYLGFLGVGEALQTRCWADFINRVAVTYGEGVIGWITAETRLCPDEPDAHAATAPTFIARGDCG